ncbi:MAG: hypothetical protein WEG40_15600 [Candidatus Rokuibacteriota bacterium]
MKSRVYEMTPIRVSLSAIPDLGDSALPVDQIRTSQEFPIAGARTLPCTTEGATREAAEMLEACKARVAGGDRWALTELLDANPAFIADSWVRYTLGRFIEQGVPLRRRGRIRGKYHFHPLIVVGLVEYLLKKGVVPSVDQAFHRLEELRILAYDAAKELYYRTRREDRFRPIVLEFPELARRVSAEELAALFPYVEMLDAGSRITRQFRDPERGDVEVAFQAL